MQNKHKVAFFVRQNGECPVEDYIFDDKNETDYEIIIAAMKYLAHVGEAIFDTKMAKQFKDHKPLCELRKNRHRIFFAEDKNLNCYIMLFADLKDTQKTPLRNLELGEKYWEEYVKYKKVRQMDIPLDFDLVNL